MKNNFFHKITAAFLALILTCGMIPPAGFTQAFPSPSSKTTLFDIKGFDKSVFDYHFSRADRELNPERWLDEARHGISQALCAWEFFAAAMYDNPLILEGARTQIEMWSNEELEARFSRWLSGRFFGETAEKAINGLSALLGETQKLYTWHLDAGGNIVFEDGTGDPSIIRPDDREFSADLDKWRSETENHVNSESASFGAVIAALYPELLAHIPHELRQTMSEVIIETGNAVNDALKREFESIAAREERIFYSRRTRDIWSLRRKSNDEAARIITERLISDAEEACARGIEELNVKIEEASAGTGDLALLGEEWLRLYQEQFDRGLRAWEDAEERFFIRRIEWEQEAFNIFSDGEEAWLTAFRLFDEGRQRWELNTKELFNSGESLFKNISENLEKSIADAKAEFEYNMTMRIGSGTAKVKAMVDMYLVCGSGAIAARENIQFWQNQYKSTNKPDPSDPGFINWLLTERRNIWQQAEASYVKSPDYVKTLAVLNSLEKYSVDYYNYLAYFNERHKVLFQIQDIIAGNTGEAAEYAFANEIKNFGILDMSSFGILIEMKRSYDLYDSYITKAEDTRNRIINGFGELIGTGILKDILLPDASSEDFCLDEYQIELIKAKALVLYWERKTSVAQAITAYAADLSAGRITETEGILAWENAKAAYNEALALYETELKKLNIIGADIQGKQLALDNLGFNLRQAEEKLQKMTLEYSALIAANAVNREDFMLMEFNVKYDFLAEEYKFLLQAGDNAVYKNMLEFGRELGIAEQTELAEEILSMLINGDGFNVLSLAGLEDMVLNGLESEISLKVRLAGIDLFADAVDSGLRPGDSEYSGADWYFKAKGINPPDTDNMMLFGDKLRLQLIEDYKHISRILLEERIALELEALEFFLDINSGEDGNGKILAQNCMVDSLTAARALEILLLFEDRLRQGGEYFTDNDEENELIGWFTAGNSFFEGTENFLTPWIDDYYLCLGLLNLYDNYAFISSFTPKEQWQEALDSLSVLLDSYGLNNAGKYLPEVQNIAEAILAKSGDFVHNTAQFLLELEQCFPLIPEWLEYELNSWMASFIEYIATNALFTGKRPIRNTFMLEIELNDLKSRYELLNDYVNSLPYISEQLIERINGEYLEIKTAEMLLVFEYQIAMVWEKLSLEEIGTGNEKHWRQFLLDEYLNNKDDRPDRASSREEGLMLDALFDANLSTNRINDAFTLYSQNSLKFLTGGTSLLYGLYFAEAERTEYFVSYAKSLWAELARIGMTYELSRMAPEELKAELERQYTELKAQEEQFNMIRNEYFMQAGEFAEIGGLYDNQYGILKKICDETEKRRFEYETQDSIRRWASTAYLDIDSIGLNDCREKLTKAQIILTVLSDIYGGETRRTYDNPEYQALYSEYEISFGRKLNVVKVLNAVQTTIAEEMIKNESLFSQYSTTLNSIGRIDQNYLNFISSEYMSEWGVKDIITVKNGRLVFSIGQSMSLNGIGVNEAAALHDFFSPAYTIPGERHEISQFEESVRELSQRMSVYLTDDKKFNQWSLARDYLLTSLIKANKELGFLKNYYSGVGDMKQGGSLSSLAFKYSPVSKTETVWSAAHHNSSFERTLKNPEAMLLDAWNSLSDEEKADLEFYIILTLSGNCNNYITGFSQVHTLDVYQRAYNFVNDYYKKADRIASDPKKLWGGGIYNEMRDINRSSKNRIKGPLDQIKKNVAAWKSGLSNNLLKINTDASNYLKSCARLDMLEGTQPVPGQYVEWEEICSTVLETGKITGTDLIALKVSWDSMRQGSEKKFTSVSAALAELTRWTVNMEELSRKALEDRWVSDEQKRLTAENEFRKAQDAFMAGTINEKTLGEIAGNAFGNGAAAWKNHLENIERALMRDLSGYLNCESDYYAEFSYLGAEYAALFTRTLNSRYSAEFAAREVEWEQQRRDIAGKFLEWQDNAARLVENGRTDWDTGALKMKEAYRQWNNNFRNEYNRVNDEWAVTYLAGLENKEKWLEMAAAAADQASSEAFLSLVGAEAERMARSMDAREPLGIRDAVPDAENLMTGLLNSSGIINMAEAFGSLNSITDLASPTVRRGMGGIAIWDASLARAAASDLARKTNMELADRESVKLAFNTRKTAEEAIRNLVFSVDSANRNFRENVDNTFIFQGLWRKSGNNYVKDIIMGSTLLQPVISERKTVGGYIDYRMEPLELKTNLEENYLAGLNSLAIRGLIENVFLELEAAAKEIFGSGSNPEKVNKTILTYKSVLIDGEWQIEDEWVKLEERDLFPGKFGAHIGYRPAVRPSGQMGGSKETIFYDRGSGELGRLMTEFIYWSVIDNRGSAQLYVAAWDKRMWDDRNSVFEAPSLRSAADVASTVASVVVTSALALASAAAAPFTAGTSTMVMLGAMPLTVGISSSSEFIFGSLDVAFGYKTIDEAGFNFGKAVLINTASALGSGIFGGFIGGAGVLAAGQGLTGAAVNAAGSTAGKVAVQAAMTGVQTVTTGLVTNAISGITYSRENGWGYSNQIVTDGARGILTGALSSMAGALTSGTMQAINSGMNMEKLTGFSNINKNNLSQLNNLAGSLAGQGISYAMGNDFTLNLLNLGLFTNSQYNSGLLELHLGRDNSVKMNIGTNGANISPENLINSFKGALVWNMNNRIDDYIKNNTFDANVALRAQYGFGDERQLEQLRNILKGRDELWTESGQDYDGKTEIIDGKRVVILGNYRTGMSAEEQMRLAVILGHEAYRDGVVSAVENFNELKDASIARILMGNRINQDYQWFYDFNMDFEFESYLLDLVKTSGNMEIFDDYLRFAYMNDEDYYWKWASTGNDYQNMDRYRSIPLFNSKSAERVEEINKQNLDTAFAKYKADLAKDEGYIGDITDFISKKGTDADLLDSFIKNTQLQKKFGYEALKFESVYSVGCMFLSAKYGLEAITGRKFDTTSINEYITENKLYVGESELSNIKMAEIMTRLAGGQYSVKLIETGSPDPALLYNLGKSNDMYLAHIRIKKEGTGTGYHSVMVSGIDYAYDKNGNVTGINAVNVANPWNGSSFTGKTSYSMDQIARWDIFMVTQNKVYGRWF